MAKKVIKSGKISFSSILGIFIIICISSFFISFIYRFITSESTDSTRQWCPTHNTYHDISEQINNEIWCNNCKTWHAPRNESAIPSIK